MAVVYDLSGLRPRHPEKAHRPDTPLLRKPDWIRVKAPGSPGYLATQRHRAREQPGHRLRGGGLSQYRRMLGEEARHLHDHGRHLHPGLRLLQCEDRLAGSARTARAGKCCAMPSPAWAWPMSSSPRSTATILADGGAEHFAEVIRAIRARCPQTTIEVLTPDFLRKDGALEQVVEARPDVFNHNLETVPSLYLTIRPGARYFHSLRLLQRVKELDPSMFTKSGIMVGLGETRNRCCRSWTTCARPTSISSPLANICSRPASTPLDRFVTPDEFKSYETIAYAKGFLMVSSSPLTRSSHHAGDDFARLRRPARLAPSNAAILVEAPRSAQRRRHVRPGGRRREISSVCSSVSVACGFAAGRRKGRRRRSWSPT